jgi:hypothetical protein
MPVRDSSEINIARLGSGSLNGPLWRLLRTCPVWDCLRLCSATLWSVPTSQRQSSLDTLKKLDKLTDELETAKHTSEATTKEVQHASRTTQRVKRDVRVQLLAERKRPKGRHIKGGKSKAAVELGQKGGAARARILTAKQRSDLATKAAKIRWNSPG